ncbi:MAG: sugar-binding protein [Armatimonadetes bacterium]|nr:sugar-binding protein [Armatimonadota bacterium]MDW8121438.1 sugar-binding protein [Armatimonadota bacterium]
MRTKLVGTLMLFVIFVIVALVGWGLPQKKEKKWRIALVPKALTGEYWVRCRKGAEAAARRLGVELIFVGPSAETEVDKQMDIVENLVVRGIDGLAISPCDASALVPVIEKIWRRKIPVVTVDSDAKTDKKLAYIGTDNEKAGALAGEELARLIQGKGKVLIINGVPGAHNLMERIKGFRRVMAKHPRVRLLPEQACQSDQTLALNITENALTGHPDLKGIFGVNAPGAPGAAQAVAAAGKAGQVKVVGFDAIPDTLRFCAEGVVQAIIEQRPYRMGYLSVEFLKKALEGEKIPTRVDTGVDIIRPEQARKMLLAKPSALGQ